VASLKAAHDSNGVQTAAGVLRGLVFRRGESVYGQHATLEQLIRFAYNPAPFTEVVGGPGWMRTTKYDVVAKAGRAASADEMRTMIRNLLADRFGLVAHWEGREMSAYVLEVAKGGPKLQETPGPEGTIRSPAPFRFKGVSATRRQLAFQLRAPIPMVVVDHAEKPSEN
jgi:uncharacterized protein (TIGR03435 family)